MGDMKYFGDLGGGGTTFLKVYSELSYKFYLKYACQLLWHDCTIGGGDEHFSCVQGWAMKSFNVFKGET